MKNVSRKINNNSTYSMNDILLSHENKDQKLSYLIILITDKLNDFINNKFQFKQNYK
jgi:hypothetical protein